MNNGYHRTPTLLRRLFRAGLALVAVLVATLSLTPVLAQDALAARAVQKKAAQAVTVYENQPPVTDKELVGFLEILPRFRAWARSIRKRPIRSCATVRRTSSIRPKRRNGCAPRAGTRYAFSASWAAWPRPWSLWRRQRHERHPPARHARRHRGRAGSGRRHLGTMLKAGGNAPAINR